MPYRCALGPQARQALCRQRAAASGAHLAGCSASGHTGACAARMCSARDGLKEPAAREIPSPCAVARGARSTRNHCSPNATPRRRRHAPRCRPAPRPQQWAAGVITPQMAEEVDRSNSFPKDVDMWREMGGFGLLGAGPPSLHHACMPTCGDTSVRPRRAPGRGARRAPAAARGAAPAAAGRTAPTASYPPLPPACRAGITAPQEYGGLGAGYSEHCIAMEVRRRGPQPPLPQRTCSRQRVAADAAGPAPTQACQPPSAPRQRAHDNAPLPSSYPFCGPPTTPPPSASLGDQPALRVHRPINAPRNPPNTASLTAYTHCVYPYRRSAAGRGPSGCPMARTATSASTSSCATAAPRRKKSTCPS